MEADRFLVFSKDEFTVLFLKESIDGQDEDESWKMRSFRSICFFPRNCCSLSILTPQWPSYFEDQNVLAKKQVHSPFHWRVPGSLRLMKTPKHLENRHKLQGKRDPFMYFILCICTSILKHTRYCGYGQVGWRVQVSIAFFEEKPGENAWDQIGELNSHIPYRMHWIATFAFIYIYMVVVFR